MTFAFPFTTCELPRKGAAVAQPFSAAANALTATLLLACLFRSHTGPVRAALGSYVLFEAWHAFSHARHIEGHMQTNVVHCLGYLMSAATLGCILGMSGSRGAVATMWVPLAALVLADIYVWARVRDVWTVFTGLSVFAFVFLGNLRLLPPFFRLRLAWMVPGLAALFLLFLNERANCEAMLRRAALPYHLGIELLGAALFYGLASGFLRWEAGAF
jgi:hypothetical protein